MAFSYSDKNFTVIGNLCFVHIDIDNKTSFDIPPAIGDRMLVNNIFCSYVGHDGDINNSDFCLATISNNKITLITRFSKGYLMSYFPIDSNK